MGTASDGRIYYVLSSESIDQGARMFRFDPQTQTIQELADLTEACGEKGRKAIPQGKSHVNFVEADGRLYFATHVGVYSIVEGKETLGIPRPGTSRTPAVTSSATISRRGGSRTTASPRGGKGC
ncbi:MAG: hypothetical protein M5U12_04405 [Verrucomicrobia bacterium]|nr:hypothetical protein [Verrucomicrobiota bacterium]